MIGGKIRPGLPWRAFSFRSDTGWRDEPLQQVPLSEKGRVDLSVGTDLSNRYRLLFQPESFGGEASASAAVPCASERLIRLEKSAHLFLYLVQCQSDTSAQFQPLKNPRFNVDNLTRTLTGPLYGFQYKQNKQILFEEIWLRENGENISVAKDANVWIRGDLKNFFALNFSTANIESRQKQTMSGEVSYVAALDFFLRIMFFRVDLELSLALSFFDSAVHIPMILQLPASPKKWVHPGSGVFYDWKSPKGKVTYDLAPSRLANFDAPGIKRGYADWAKEGLKFCSPGESICHFTLVIRPGNRVVTMHYLLNRSLVERGFFPAFAPDSDQAAIDLKWISKVRAGSVAGMQTPTVYFEVSGLDAGEFVWDFWLDIEEGPTGSECPGRVSVGP